MKSGGADVHVINRQVDNGDGQDWRGSIVANARKVADVGTEDCPLVGYVVVGMFADGMTSVGFRHDPERCPIPRALMPAWIAEVFRRELIVEPEAADKFNEMFEWRDG